MFGLILAALYVAFAMVSHETTMETAAMWTMPFLWVWHIIWLAVFACIVGVVFLISGGATALGKGEVRAMGAAGMFVATPILMILGSIGGALFLGGVYCVGESIAVCPDTGGALPFAQWNTQLFIIGCVLYGLGALKQITTKLSSSSSKSS